MESLENWKRSLESGMREPVSQPGNAAGMRGSNSVVTLTGHQVQQLVEFLGGDLDSEISISVFEERTDIETGEKMPAGLYVWMTEYPEEGSVGPLERESSTAAAG